MSPRPTRQRPGGPSLVPSVQALTVGAPAPDVATGEALRVRLAAVALNPLNRRDVHANPAAIAALAESLRDYKQMKASTVVTRAAFVAIFPEHAEAVGGAAYVQVDGARRRAAAEQAGVPDLAVTVDDSYATSRLRFIGATTEENLQREDLNPIEEAEQIAVLVNEVATQAAAAEQLRRTPAWVTQRLNLLKLIPDVQAALRTGQIGVRDVRNLHRDSPDGQAAALRRLLAAAAAKAERDRREDVGKPEDQPKAPPRPSAFTRAIQRDRVKLAATVRAELPAAEVRAFAAELLRDLDG